MRIRASVHFSVALVSVLSLAAADRPAFEVASIRAASPVTLQMVMAGKANVGTKVNGDRVDIGYQTLKDLIPVAYGVKAFQVTVPSSISSIRYNIVAKLPSGATKEQVPALLR